MSDIRRCRVGWVWEAPRAFISFLRCRVERENGRIPPREVLWNPNFGSPVRVTRMFGGLQTTSGKVYKDATVSRIGADGIELKTKTGISKVYFTELPQEVQERFHWAKPAAPRAPFYSRWAAAAEDPAVLAKIIAAGASIIASVGLVIGHIRSRRQPTTRATRASRLKAVHRYALVSSRRILIV